MTRIQLHQGQPSYTIENGSVSAQTTVQGGHVTAQFRGKNRVINPFFVAPWWRESRLEGVDEVVNVLRGCWFCLPFGANTLPLNGRKYPVHGQTASSAWERVQDSIGGCDGVIHLAMDLDDGQGRVIKTVRIREGDPILYLNNRVIGLFGRFPVAYHPTLLLSEKIGSCILSVSKPVGVFTAPTQVEDPSSGGYSLLKPDVEVADLSRVPTAFGSTVDLTRHPISSGFEDVTLLASDPQMEFAFTAVALPKEGYLYFQLKDPRKLRSTLLWMSNGGRHYPPWNGRVRNVLGVEEVTSFFHYGAKESSEPNALSNRGIATAVSFNGVEQDFPFIIGATEIGSDFSGVKSIIRNGDAAVTIVGQAGERIEVPCRINFLSESADDSLTFT